LCQALLGLSADTVCTMASSSDGGLLEAGSDSDDGAMLDAPVDGRRGPYRMQDHGPNFVVAVFVDREDKSRVSDHMCEYAPRDVSSHRFWFFGLLSMSWVLDIDGSIRAARKLVKGSYQRLYSTQRPAAWVDYCVEDACDTDPVSIEFGPDHPKHLVVIAIGALISQRATLSRFAQRSVGAVTNFMFVSPRVATCIFNRCTSNLYSLPVVGRSRSWPFSVGPSLRSLRRRLAARNQSETVVQPVVSNLITKAHRPAAVAESSYLTNPLSMLAFLQATQYLKAQRLLDRAANAVVRALWPEDAQTMVNELLQGGFVFPSYNSLCKARPQLDGCAMLLERFEWNLGRFARAPGRIRSIHLTADGSPNSGRDLFGVIMET
jgi:hypothetical protein